MLSLLLGVGGATRAGAGHGRALRARALALAAFVPQQPRPKLPVLALETPALRGAPPAARRHLAAPTERGLHASALWEDRTGARRRRHINLFVSAGENSAGRPAPRPASRGLGRGSPR